jgi:GT2 family glycosyltransferase
VAKPHNPGVSECYNEAAQMAEKSGRGWLLFLDQDATFGGDFLRRCHDSVCAFPDEVAFCPVLRGAQGQILSPFGFRFNRPFILGAVKPGPHSLAGRAIANNGMLVALRAFASVGGYDPRVQLDYADISFVHRLRRLTGTFVVVDSRLVHDLSSLSETSKERALRRFERFCESAYWYSKEHSPLRGVMLYTFLRSLRLSWRWRDAHFAQVFLGSSFLSRRRGT